MRIPLLCMAAIEGGAAAAGDYDALVDKAARHLRETTQASKAYALAPWANLPKSAKKKWVELARGTLEAAAVPAVYEALKALLEGMEASGGWDGDDSLFSSGMAAIKQAEARQ